MKKLKRQIVRGSQNMHANAVQSKSMIISVTKGDIENAECRKPTKCMIKVAVKRALNLAHGYIHVDATGISISRNGSYREKSFMPNFVVKQMLSFDQHQEVKPFRFKAVFHKTAPIQKKSEVSKERRYAKELNVTKKKYDMRSRVIGVAIAGGAQVAA